MTKKLQAESETATLLLEGKVVKKIWRHREGELVIEFCDNTRLFVDRTPEGLELSII